LNRRRAVPPSNRESKMSVFLQHLIRDRGHQRLDLPADRQPGVRIDPASPRTGFTLIELLIVIGLFGAVAMIMLASLGYGQELLSCRSNALACDRRRSGAGHWFHCRHLSALGRLAGRGERSCQWKSLRGRRPDSVFHVPSPVIVGPGLMSGGLSDEG
jgi:prepilin-type N-terminal cleavage/methylation domain-containing protein